MSKRRVVNHLRFFAALLIVVVAIQLVRDFRRHQTKTPAIVTAIEQPPGFNKQLHSTDEAGSLWWIVNKKRPLPEGYQPSDLVVPKVSLRLNSKEEQMQLRQEPAAAVQEMFSAAGREGLELVLSSGFRSARLQAILYNSYVASDGEEAADHYSAKPGTSEHQTGLAVDIISHSHQCDLQVCFANLPESQWLNSRAAEFGFIVRYPPSKESVTGYTYEPWHFRYVGKELAGELSKSGLTMEEFFGLQ